MLNPEQQAVVEHGSGPLRVAAVAGSGKTTALVERVAYLVEKRNVHPRSILMISFSRVARDEMQKRIDRRLPTHQAHDVARTFHSIGLDIYRATKRDAGEEFHIDTTGLLYLKATQLAYKELGMEAERKRIMRFAGLVKNGLLAPLEAVHRLGGEVPAKMMDAASDVVAGGGMSASDLVSVFFKAEQIRKHRGVEHNGEMVRFVTFDDMICDTAQLLRDSAAARDSWGNRWGHIFQDEAQDANAAQIMIANCLAKKHRNYVIVGDPCQAIYGWRGAQPESMLHFNKEWPDAKTIVMHRNYRSGIEVIDVSNRVMGHMPASSVITDDYGDSTDMTSERQTRSFVGAVDFNSAREEGEAIAANIREHFSQGVPWEHHAILVRMNRMTVDIEIALAKMSVPYKLLSGSSFFSMKEMKIVLGYLRVAMGSASKDDIRHSLMYPSRGIGKKFVDSVTKDHEDGDDWVSVIESSMPSARPFQQRSLNGWLGIIAELRRKESDSPRDVVKLMLEMTQMVEWLKKDSDDSEDSSSADSVLAIVDFASSYETMGDMLSEIAKIESHRDASAKKRKAVVISTVHKAKGREWPVVFLPQLADGLFPVARADIHEERRVFYVAVTRAMDELWLSYSSVSGASSAIMSGSRFFDEVKGLVPWVDKKVSGRQIDLRPVGTQLTLL